MKSVGYRQYKAFPTFLLALFFIPYSHATTLEKTELIIGLGNFEPMFADENKPALFKDLIDGVFKYLPQYDVSYRFMLSNSRLEQDLAANRLDGAANIFKKTTATTCLTKPFFRFTDVAITQKKHSIVIDNISQLAQYSVVSYQNATKLLGDEYRNSLTHNQHYQEVSQPEQQALLLSQGLVDVSIGDKFIFLYSLQQLRKKALSIDEFEFHPIFPAGYTSMGFSHVSLCLLVNEAIDKFVQSGGYESVYRTHLKTLGYHPLVQDIAH